MTTLLPTSIIKQISNIMSKRLSESQLKKMENLPNEVKKNSRRYSNSYWDRVIQQYKDKRESYYIKNPSGFLETVFSYPYNKFIAMPAPSDLIKPIFTDTSKRNKFTENIIK